MSMRGAADSAQHLHVSPSRHSRETANRIVDTAEVDPRLRGDEGKLEPLPFDPRFSGERVGARPA